MTENNNTVPLYNMLGKAGKTILKGPGDSSHGPITVKLPLNKEGNSVIHYHSHDEAELLRIRRDIERGRIRLFVFVAVLAFLVGMTRYVAVLTHW